MRQVWRRKEWRERVFSKAAGHEPGGARILGCGVHLGLMRVARNPS